MTQVKLILTSPIHNLGESGDLVSVKPGYARNYLLPQGKAILATENRVKELEHHKRIVAEKAAKEFENLQESKKALDAVRIEIAARAGDNGKLFGSVTSAQIAEKIAEQGFELDRRRIELKETIKEIGEHKVAYRLHRELAAEVTVLVMADGGPAPSDELDALAPDEPRRDDRDERDEADEDEDDTRGADAGDSADADESETADE